MQDFITKFRNGKIAINCKTQEQADDLMELLNKNDFVWNGYKRRNLLTNNLWYIYKDQTCYHFKGTGIQFCNIGYYTKNDIEIISFDEL